jgi:hypothetical protein
MIGMLTGNYNKYMEPINMIKNYYGDKYAYQIVFHLHYMAWLLIPSVLCLLVMGKVAFEFYLDQNFEQILDNSFNGYFGLAMIIWSTCFNESWKRKQTTINFYWGCQDNSYSS